MLKLPIVYWLKLMWQNKLLQRLAVTFPKNKRMDPNGVNPISVCMYLYIYLYSDLKNSNRVALTNSDGNQIIHYILHKAKIYELHTYRKFNIYK